MVKSPNIESRLCRVGNLQFFSPDYVVQAMSYVESHIESRLCSPGYVVCEIADFRVQAMSSFRVHAIVVQAMYSHACFHYTLWSKGRSICSLNSSLAAVDAKLTLSQTTY
jgi:hypothetical protein